MSQISAPAPKKKKQRPTVPSFDLKAAKKLEEQEIKKEQNIENTLQSLKQQIPSSPQSTKMEVEPPKPKVDQKKSMMDKINNMFQKKVTTTKQDSQQASNNNSENSLIQGKSISGQREYKKSLIHNDDEEYDPSKPNDYEYFKQKIKQKQRGQKSLVQEQKEKQERLKEIERQQKLKKQQEEDNYKEILEEEKRLFSLNDIKQTQQQKQPEKEIRSTEEKALKIMSKFGFKLGKGLGKNEDGITAPIMHMKVSDNIGVMTQGAGDVTSILPQDLKYRNYIEQCGLKASKVIVMLNLVNPNEIDEDLEAEVIEECQIYGNVQKSIVFMMPNQPADQQVRIFVMFENVQSAINGFANIHRRNFGGREVKCVFYDEADFLTNKFDKPLKFPVEPENMEIEQ